MPSADEFLDGPGGSPQNADDFLDGKSSSPGSDSILGNDKSYTGAGLTAQAIDYMTSGNRPTEFWRGLTTNEPANSGPAAVGRMLPSAGLSLMFPEGGPASAAAGESLRQALAAKINQDNPSPLSTVIGEPVKQAAMQALFQYGVPAARGALSYTAKNTAGVAASAVNTADELGAGAVSRYVGAAADVGDQLANSIRSKISDAIQGGKDAYQVLVGAAKSDPELASTTFNLQKALGDKVLGIADNFGYMSTPGLKANPEAAKFWKFAGQVDGLQNANFDQIYEFQKQLNGLARQNVGKPLGAAFGQLKNEVTGLITRASPDLAQANSQYAAAKGLEDATGKIVDSNDLIGFINKAYKNPLATGTKDTLADAAAQVPGLGGLFNDARAYQAAQSFNPAVRGLPQTGMGAALGYGAGKLGTMALAENPLTYPVAAAGAIATSPRAHLALMRAFEALNPFAAQAASIPAAGAGAALSNYWPGWQTQK